MHPMDVCLVGGTRGEFLEGSCREDKERGLVNTCSGHSGHA